jgi:hypothetical protein
MMTPERVLRENHARAEGGNGNADTRASTNRLPGSVLYPARLFRQRVIVREPLCGLPR